MAHNILILAFAAFLLAFGCIGSAPEPTGNGTQIDFPAIVAQPAGNNTTMEGNAAQNNQASAITKPGNSLANTTSNSGASSRFWYFAYGSNLDVNGMHSRVGDWPEARPAALHGFSRTFAGAADIRQNATSQVFGAIYLLNESQMQRLDRYEGAPMVYRRINVTVASGGQALPAVAYQYTTARPFGPPSQAYFNTISKGLLAYGYGDEQIRLLYLEANYSKNS